MISITPLWTFETVMPDEHVARRCPQAEGHQASRGRNEYKGIENILKATLVSLYLDSILYLDSRPPAEF